MRGLFQSLYAVQAAMPQGQSSAASARGLASTGAADKDGRRQIARRACAARRDLPEKTLLPPWRRGCARAPKFFGDLKRDSPHGASEPFARFQLLKGSEKFLDSLRQPKLSRCRTLS